METRLLLIPDWLADEELSTPLTGRSLSNMTFFEYVHSVRGLEGTMSVVGEIAESGLGSVGGIGELVHGHGKALTDGRIEDQGGVHSYPPPAVRNDLAEGMWLSNTVEAFGVERLEVSVGSGEYACLRYPNTGNLDIFASWRAGTSGEGGSWTSQLPASVQGDSVFLLSAADPGGVFSIFVEDTGEEPDCEEEDERDASGDDCLIEFCDPSEYFHTWENMRNIVIDQGSGS